MKLTFNRGNDDLLVKYLLGETTPEEKERVSRWIVADPDHKNYADDLLKIWQASLLLAPPEPVDAQAAWQRFRQSGKIPVTVGEETKPARVVKPDRMYTWRAVAAAIILLATGIGGWWFLTRKAAGKEEIAVLSIKTRSAVQTDTLPDGSRVTLNKNSSLVLPGKWGRGSRVARLTGEAFFQVVHEPSRPFTVEIGGVTIRDVGTSFNVRSVNGTTEIIVEDGVIIVTDSLFSVRAVAGEKVVVAAAHAGITKTNASDQLYRYYRTKKFICHNTPLAAFVAVLNEAYGAGIVLQGDSTADLQLTANFDNEDLNGILSVVVSTFHLAMQKKGDQIILKQP